MCSLIESAYAAVLLYRAWRGQLQKHGKLVSLPFVGNFLLVYKCLGLLFFCTIFDVPEFRCCDCCCVLNWSCIHMSWATGLNVIKTEEINNSFDVVAKSCERNTSSARDRLTFCFEEETPSTHSERVLDGASNFQWRFRFF